MVSISRSPVYFLHTVRLLTLLIIYSTLIVNVLRAGVHDFQLSHQAPGRVLKMRRTCINPSQSLGLRLPEPMRSCRVSRFASRSYSARVFAESPKPIKTIADLRAWIPAKGEDHEVEVSGWVKNVRKSSAVRFVDISDGSSMRPVQAVVDRSLPGAMEWVVS